MVGLIGVGDGGGGIGVGNGGGGKGYVAPSKIIGGGGAWSPSFYAYDTSFFGSMSRCQNISHLSTFIWII